MTPLLLPVHARRVAAHRLGSGWLTALPWYVQMLNLCLRSWSIHENAGLTPDGPPDDTFPPPPYVGITHFCVSSFCWNLVNVGEGDAARLRSIMFVTGVPHSVGTIWLICLNLAEGTNQRPLSQQLTRCENSKRNSTLPRWWNMSVPVWM